MESLWAKVISLLVLATFTIVSGLLPLRISGHFKGGDHKGHRLLQVLLAFSGGVLFATCFLHLIPEVRQDLDRELTTRYGNSLAALLPWGELSVCVGFFVIYGIEEVVEYFVCRSCEKQHHHHGQHSDTDRGTAMAVSPQPCLAPVHSVHGSHRASHDPRDCTELKVTDETTPLVGSHHSASVDRSKLMDGLVDGLVRPQRTAVRNSLTGLLLICALSFHSIFEGMAIGLQVTAGDVWNALLGIALHKFVLAFCVGIELVSLRTPLRVFFVYILTFAMVSPIGVAIGTAVTETGGNVTGDSSLATVALQGLASGTLLYVTFFEILTKTKGTELASLMNFAAMVIGFAVMAGLHTLG